MNKKLFIAVGLALVAAGAWLGGIGGTLLAAIGVYFALYPFKDTGK